MRTQLTAIALALGTASAAHAQAPDKSFCAQAPDEMLSAVSGQWTIRQGPGVATAGGFSGNRNFPMGQITIPLPPHKGKRFTITYDPKTGYGSLAGDGQKMDMVAAGKNELAKVSKYLDAQDLKGLVDKKQGCDWYSLPLMVGSKMYRLKGVDPGSKEADWWMFLPVPGQPMLLCLTQDGRLAADFTDGSMCESPPREIDAKGDMKMSVIVKFQSPTSGGGVLLFEGKSDGYPFAAVAPIKFSR